MSSPSDTADMSTQPFVWVIIPLIAVFAIAAFVVFVWNRQRRMRNSDHSLWPEDRVLVGSSYVRYRRGMRWGPWSDTRSMEGLNELGEAPPPYDTKKPPAINAQQVEQGQSGSELRNAEAGLLPPAYPAQPEPVAVAGGREP